MKIRHIVPIVLLVLAAASAAPAATPSHGVVNVNQANAAQLELLPRVGPALAKRIVEFRKANGPFKSIDDLLAVRGIGERSLEHLRPYVTLTEKTTLTEKVHLPRKSQKPSPKS